MPPTLRPEFNPNSPDYHPGARPVPGGSVFVTPSGGSSGGPTGGGGLSSNVVQSSFLQANDPANQKINFGTNTGAVNYSGLNQGLQVSANESLKTFTDQKNAVNTNIDNIFGQFLQNEADIKTPSSADAFSKAQRETGILQKQQIVGDLTGQLNQIVATSQAQQLQVTGQGRGIPEVIIGGQQAQIAKEAAIQALPIAAQLSAAQGNLAMAESNLNTLFKIYSDDANNEYNRKTKLNEQIFTFLTGREQTKLASIQKQEDRAYAEGESLRKTQENYAMLAFGNNQGALGAKLASLDPKSPTYRTDLAKLQSQISDPVKALQERKLREELTSTDIGTLVKIDGVDYIRYKDGTISLPVLPEAADKITTVERIKDKIILIDGLAKNSVALAVSAGSLRGAPIPFLFKNSINDWRAGMINLISKLTVDELGRVKSDGVTFGQLSNGERQAVGDAATILSSGQIYDGKGDDRTGTGRFRLSERKVQEALNTINKYYKIDFERKAGMSYSVYQQNPGLLGQQETQKSEDRLNAIYSNPQNASIIEQAIRQFPDYDASQILQILGI